MCDSGVIITPVAASSRFSVYRMISCSSSYGKFRFSGCGWKKKWNEECRLFAGSLEKGGNGLDHSLKVNCVNKNQAWNAFQPLRKDVIGSVNESRFAERKQEDPGVRKSSISSKVLNLESQGDEQVELNLESGVSDVPVPKTEEKEVESEFRYQRIDQSSSSSVPLRMKEEIKGEERPSEDSYDFLKLQVDFEEMKRSAKNSAEDSEDGDFVSQDSSERNDAKMNRFGEFGGDSGLKSGKQVVRRSNMLAKQVISLQSALSLGFVSQLWVNTKSWEVLLVEARPNLLSGEMERFLLEDIYQIGDVVLVPDENVIENELNMIGLDTLVGYNVVTQGRHNVGKVRGYTFNINSGAVELLEIDSFGISILPASLVSTYGLLVEDVAEVTFDTVIVYNHALSRLQRLTKGFLDNMNAEGFRALEEYSDPRRRFQKKGKYRKRNLRHEMRNMEDGWDLPMEF